jgi:hypothetical protein
MQDHVFRDLNAAVKTLVVCTLLFILWGLFRWRVADVVLSCNNCTLNVNCCDKIGAKTSRSTREKESFVLLQNVHIFKKLYNQM